MHRSIRTLSKSVAVLLAVSIVPGALAARAEQHADGSPRGIVRECIGGYIEKSAVITRGLFADHIPASDGYEVIGIPLNANSDQAAATLVDRSDVQIAHLPCQGPARSHAAQFSTEPPSALDHGTTSRIRQPNGDLR